MAASSILEDVQPLRGKIVPVRSVQETRPAEEFADAYVAEVNQRSASEVAKALDAAYPRDHSLSHLRRFAKADMLPDHLKPAGLRERSRQTIYVLIFPPLPEISELRSILAPFVPAPVAEKIDDDHDHDHDHKTASLTTCTVEEGDFPILTTQVPLQSPLSPQQAARWSQTMWPVMYNPAAPRAMIAPPPQILSQAYESIRPRAGFYLSLAYKVAEETKRLGRGREIGVVVVDPRNDTGDNNNNNNTWRRGIVAVAGDARYCAPGVPRELLAEQQASSVSELASRRYNSDLEGGPELHAIMRAAALIANRRLADDYEDAPVTLSGSGGSGSGSGPVYNPPLTPLESYFLYQPPEKEKEESTAACFEKEEEEEEEEVSGSGPSPRILPRSQGGYLCTDLDIYITHEPCLSCSMGMLLSRFRAVIFPRRGRMVTGGLASEPVSTADDDDDDDDSAADSSGEEEKRERRERREKRERERERERNYYGLHWRKELNWRALCFEFIEDEPQQQQQQQDEVVDFHA